MTMMNQGSGLGSAPLTPAELEKLPQTKTKAIAGSIGGATAPLLIGALNTALDLGLSAEQIVAWGVISGGILGYLVPLLAPRNKPKIPR